MQVCYVCSLQEQYVGRMLEKKKGNLATNYCWVLEQEQCVG